MSIEIIGMLTLGLGLAGLFKGETFAIYVFVLSTLLGSAAAVIITAIGASIQPAHILLGFLMLVVFAKPGMIRQATAGLTFPKPGFWLLCTWLYGVLGAIFLPRLLMGQIYVNSIGVSAYGISFTPLPIAPASGNITQSVYFTGDLVCFLACSVAASSMAGFRSLGLAILGYCIANLIFALLDLGTFWTGTGFLLEFMRNSTYVIYTDAMVGDLRRIIGSFTEASSFAFATLGTFAFSLQLWLNDLYPRLTFFVAIISLVLLILSTSTTAYVALPIYLVLLYGRSFIRLFEGRAPKGTALFIVFAPLFVTMLVAGILLYPPASDMIGSFLQGMVFEKGSSQSGIDRGRINLEAVQVFWDTLGVGTGIGSVRASSFVLAVLANLGIIGGLTYALFIGTTLGRFNPGGGDPFFPAMRAAARAAAVSQLISSSISGALIDLGLPFFVLAALACATPDIQPAPARLNLEKPIGRLIRRADEVPE